MAKAFKLSDVKPDLEDIRNKSILRGEYSGFECLDKIYTAKKGYPLYIAGAPHSGKTEFVLELMINWSQLHGWKFCLYLGENGTPAEIYADLCTKFVGKAYRRMAAKGKVNQYAMTEAERTHAEMWIDEHFVIVGEDFNFNFDTKHNAELTIKSWYKLVNDTENQLGIKFDGTCFDPFNDIDEEDEIFHGKIDRYLKYSLTYVKGVSRHFHRIDVLVTHIADLKPIHDTRTNIRYYPEALPNEWAGGRMWHRKGFTMLLVYRPPAGFDKDATGAVYKENETVIINQKAKPKGSGKLGRCSIYLDWERSRYYEIYKGKQRYAGTQEPEPEPKPDAPIKRPNYTIEGQNFEWQCKIESSFQPNPEFEEDDELF